MTVRFKRGDILLVSAVPDQNCVNPKTRPVLLVADCTEADGRIAGVAISSQPAIPLPDTHFPLPFGRPGVKCGTGLTAPSDAICEWRVAAVQSDVVKKIGYAPTKVVLAVMVRLLTLVPRGDD